MNVHCRNVLHLKIKRLKVIIILESVKTLRNSHLTSESVCWGSNWLLLLTHPLGWWCWCEEYHYSKVSCSYKQWQLHYKLDLDHHGQKLTTQKKCGLRFMETTKNYELCLCYDPPSHDGECKNRSKKTIETFL